MTTTASMKKLLLCGSFRSRSDGRSWDFGWHRRAVLKEEMGNTRTTGGFRVQHAIMIDFFRRSSPSPSNCIEAVADHDRKARVFVSSSHTPITIAETLHSLAILQRATTQGKRRRSHAFASAEGFLHSEVGWDRQRARAMLNRHDPRHDEDTFTFHT